MDKETINIRISSEIAKYAKKEAERTKRTFSLFVEYVLELHKKGKK